MAEYCENNYFQCDNKRAALEETKGYTTQSLASVAYQINTLAYNFLQMLDLQSSQIREMESQINHISQTVSIHKEKVARREIGVLTTNKCSNSQDKLFRQYKIIAPANPERPIKYVRKPIDYSCLDHIGHGVTAPQSHQMPRQISKAPSQYAPGLGKSQYGSIGNVSQVSAGPAPTSKPPTPPLPTPPQALYRQHSEGAVYGSRAQPDPQLYMSKGQVEATYGSRVMRPPVSEAAVPGVSAVYGTRAQLEATYNTRAQLEATYGTRGQMAQLAQMDPSYGTRGQPGPAPGQDSSMYSTRPQLAEQNYQRSVSTVSNPDSLYSTRGQLTDQAYKRSVSQTSNPGKLVGGPEQKPQQQQQQPSGGGGGGGYSRQSSTQSLPSWVPRNYLDKVLAIYDYNADKEDELTFQEGQTIYVLKKNDDGWWEGVMEGITGLFPGNYVEGSV